MQSIAKRVSRPSSQWARLQPPPSLLSRSSKCMSLHELSMSASLPSTRTHAAHAYASEASTTALGLYQVWLIAVSSVAGRQGCSITGFSAAISLYQLSAISLYQESDWMPALSNHTATRPHFNQGRGGKNTLVCARIHPLVHTCVSTEHATCCLRAATCLRKPS